MRICPRPDGHLQAVGHDARGRRQYRYHPAFRARREAAKFGGLAAFGAALPAIREAVRRDLDRPGMPREKVLALVIRLLDSTQLRIGNLAYRRGNRTYGLTTLLNRHATVAGRQVRLRFRGKAGIVHEAAISDRTIARLVRRCQQIPGGSLFEYVDDGGVAREVHADAVNEYLRDVAGPAATAKVFRTWGATVAACRALADDSRWDGRGGSPGRPGHVLRAALREVADQLGNTPAVAKASYVHPAVLRALEDSTLATAVRRARSRHRRADGARGRSSPTALSPDEQATLALLRAATGR